MNNFSAGNMALFRFHINQKKQQGRERWRAHGLGKD